MSEPLFTPQEQAIIARGERLRILVQQEGWRDLVAISTAIVALALNKLETYEGLDANKTASLAEGWKTLKTHHQMLIATVKDQIKEGTNMMLRQQQPPQQDPDSDGSFPAVIPLCDMEQNQQNQ